MKTRGFAISICFSGILAFLLISGQLHAQTRDVQPNNQYWLGYMTSATISEKYSIWNDFHLVPQGFGVVRTGLTRHLTNTSITAGYAFLWLPPGSDKTSLTRLEHRPWGQIQFNLPLSRRYTLTQRLRYDARFREKLVNGELVEGFNFNHRARFLVIVKRMLNDDPTRNTRPYVSISNEVLLNFGHEVSYNTFDQNRISIAFGIQTPKTQYQLGFMNRFVQTGPARYTANHTLVLWITQRFDLAKTFGQRNNQKAHQTAASR